MSYAIDRAIERGIDAARIAGKDVESEYTESHPMFRWWFAALVKAFDFRDWPPSRIRQSVLAEQRRRAE